ncbi:MAG: hypothetical protein HY689_15435 [Chloroflexi bacterium]|nr:hypothetical protein [Chloroflexota bacterium]
MNRVDTLLSAADQHERLGEAARSDWEHGAVALLAPPAFSASAQQRLSIPSGRGSTLGVSATTAVPYRRQQRGLGWQFDSYRTAVRATTKERVRTMTARGAGPRPWLLLPLLSVLVLAAGCSSATTVPGPSGTQTATLTAQEFAFSPQEIVLRAGVPVRLTMVNEGKLEHDITALGLHNDGDVADTHDMQGPGHTMETMLPGMVHVSANGGGRAAVDFTPRAGTFEFYCSIAGHREAGMRGILRVE